MPVQFKVGDVIRHRRYHYRGVIYGWDAECKAEEDWMQQMRIDQLPGTPFRQFDMYEVHHALPLTCLQPVSQGRNLYFNRTKQKEGLSNIFQM